MGTVVRRQHHVSAHVGAWRTTLVPFFAPVNRNMKTPSSPSFSLAQRAVWAALATAFAVTVVVSCGTSQPDGMVTNNGLPALSSTSTSSTSGIVTPPGPGTAVTPSATVPGTVVTPTPVTPGNTVITPVTPVTPPAGTTDPAVSNGEGTSPPEEDCVDVEPPPDPEWPDATCQTWATETTECEAAWFAEYCDISCGRCVPASGIPEPEPEPCEDKLPPPDPEWPDATCQNWATETTECEADWFAEYCDISCGRCVPEGGNPTPEPEPEKCEDLEPPPDPEWPGATCAEWASETEECGADWFAEYCDISCGRCVPEGGVPEEPSGAIDCSGEGLPNVVGGDGFATRYWDCCQPHCAQFDGHKCSQDGTTRTGDGTSSCNGGGSFACYDEAPRAVSDCLSYGHIAKANPNCGACYRLQFTGEGYHTASDPGSQLIKGKQMIVKVTNTGSDVAGNQFDLMVPGGGVGQFNACSRQWGTNDLGAQYGGFLTECQGSHAQRKECVRTECMKIPAGPARDGCLWFVDWFQVADNPKFTSQQVDCPF